MHIPVLVLAVIGCPSNSSKNTSCMPEFISKTIMVDNANNSHYAGAFALDFNGTSFSKTELTLDVSSANGANADLPTKSKPFMPSLIRKISGINAERPKPPAAPQRHDKSHSPSPPTLIQIPQKKNVKPRTVHVKKDYGFNPTSQDHIQRVPVEILAHKPPYSSDLDAQTPLGHKLFAQECLASHNTIRRANGLPALIWDSNLASVSYAYSDKLSASGGKLVHSNSGTGENLYGGVRQPFVSCDHAVRSWESEEGRYIAKGKPAIRLSDYAEYGHWTQLVWRDTQRVGCGYSQINGLVTVTCNYWPAGNVLGQTPN